MSSTLTSSEFLQSLIPHVIGLALIILGVIKGQENLVNLGVVMLTGTAATYNISRGLAKFGTATPAQAANTDTEAAAVVAGVK